MKCANTSGGVGWASVFILAADSTLALVLVKSNSFEQLKEVYSARNWWS